MGLVALKTSLRRSSLFIGKSCRGYGAWRYFSSRLNGSSICEVGAASLPAIVAAVIDCNLPEVRLAVGIDVLKVYEVVVIARSSSGTKHGRGVGQGEAPDAGQI